MVAKDCVENGTDVPTGKDWLGWLNRGQNVNYLDEKLLVFTLFEVEYFNLFQENFEWVRCDLLRSWFTFIVFPVWFIIIRSHEVWINLLGKLLKLSIELFNESSLQDAFGLGCFMDDHLRWKHGLVLGLTFAFYVGTFGPLPHLILHVPSSSILAENVKDTGFGVYFRWFRAVFFSLALDKVWTLGFSQWLVAVWVLTGDEHLVVALGAISSCSFLTWNRLTVCDITDILARFRSHMVREAFRILSSIKLSLLSVWRNADSESSSELKFIRLPVLVDLGHKKTIYLLFGMLCNFLVFNTLQSPVVGEQSVKYIVHHLVRVGTEMVLEKEVLKFHGSFFIVVLIWNSGALSSCVESVAKGWQWALCLA